MNEIVIVFFCIDFISFITQYRLNKEIVIVGGGIILNAGRKHITNLVLTKTK